MLSFKVRILNFISNDHVRSILYDLLTQIYFAEWFKKPLSWHFQVTIKRIKWVIREGKHTLIIFLSFIFVQYPCWLRHVYKYTIKNFDILRTLRIFLTLNMNKMSSKHHPEFIHCIKGIKEVSQCIFTTNNTTVTNYYP